MPTYKATIFYAGLTQGWSESFYFDGLDSHERVANALVRADGILFKRRACLPSVYSIVGYRISQTDRARDGLAGQYGVSAFGNAYSVPANERLAEQEPPDVAVNVRLYGNNSQWRNYLVRGLPADALSISGQNIRDAGPWRTAFNAYLAALRAEAPNLRVATAGAKVGLTDLQRIDGKIVAITTDAPIPAFAVNDTIQISQARGIAPINGRYRVIEALAGNVYTVARRLQTSTGTLMANTGRVCRVVYSYPVIVRSLVVGISNRQTGRPFNASRGRALVRRG